MAPQNSGVSRLSGGEVKVRRYTLGAGVVHTMLPPGWDGRAGMGTEKSSVDAMVTDDGEVNIIADIFRQKPRANLFNQVLYVPNVSF